MDGASPGYGFERLRDKALHFLLVRADFWRSVTNRVTQCLLLAQINTRGESVWAMEWGYQQPPTFKVNLGSWIISRFLIQKEAQICLGRFRVLGLGDESRFWL